MKKLPPVAFVNLFKSHVWSFIESLLSPSELSQDHAVAVSGGRDSMILLWLLKTYHEEGKVGSVRGIFVHHHTRAGQDEELDLVRTFCQKENLLFKDLHLQMLDATLGNFEARARKKRSQALLGELEKNEFLWMGQHLDDSFEWSFMQRSRTGNFQASLGIPVRNKKIIRPFMCVTRDQVKHLAGLKKIPYLEDPTNLDLRYDRNYVRHQIVPFIKKRYPKYLKFYASFANYSASMLHMNLLTSNLGPKEPSKLFVYREGAALLGQTFSLPQIQQLIHRYSSSSRGEIMTPIVRMLEAIKSGKKGPFHFSGGVNAYYSRGLLMLYLERVKNDDERMAQALGELSDDHLKQMPPCSSEELNEAWKKLLQRPNALFSLPGLVVVLESRSLCKTLNTSVFDPLFPKVSEVCRQRGLRFLTFQKCLDVWRQKEEKLPKKLRLLPLSNLSHLFTSQ